MSSWKVLVGVLTVICAVFVVRGLSAPEGMQDLTIHIPAPIRGGERLRRFEEPLRSALATEELGRVIGSWSDRPDNLPMIAVEVALEIRRPDVAIPLVVGTLRQAESPKGTTVTLAEGRPIDVWATDRVSFPPPSRAQPERWKREVMVEAVQRAIDEVQGESEGTNVGTSKSEASNGPDSAEPAAQ